MKEKLFDYVVQRGADLDFANHFWKGCEPVEIELRQHSRFCETIRFFCKGKSQIQIAIETGTSASTIHTWVSLRQAPRLVHYLAAFLQLGPPRNQWVWLSVNNSHGYGIPYGPFVEVPRAITKWEEVEHVLEQLHPLKPMPERLTRAELFGFLLGMVIGDTAKSKQGRWRRHLSLVLSKRYDTNERIGEFASRCATSIGLRMRRMKDEPRKQEKPHGFYTWASQSSPLFDWMFNVCLGLNDDELTTYDPVRMEWVFDAPEDFRRGLLQGLAESDGSVSIASQAVEFWVGPSWDFVVKLLGTFGLRGFRNREAITLSKSQAIKAFEIPVFSPELQTVRYHRLKTMATARRIPRGQRLPDNLRQTIGKLAAEGFSVPGVVVRLVEVTGILVSFETAQRWAGRPRKGAAFKPCRVKMTQIAPQMAK
jgi:hypothetical protein